VQAKTSGDIFSIFTNAVHPNESIDLQELQLIALYGGFNTYSSFEDWVQARYPLAYGSEPEAKWMDSNNDGRSNFDEYVFNSVASFDFANGTIQLGNRAKLNVQLRASDSLLKYSLDISDDLETWKNVGLEFNNKKWVCTDESIQVVESKYDGYGVWSVGLVCADSTINSAFFKLYGSVN
jgi:hypothetical protein